MTPRKIVHHIDLETAVPLRSALACLRPSSPVKLQVRCRSKQMACLANRRCSTRGCGMAAFSVTNFGIFFDGIHDHLLARAPSAGAGRFRVVGFLLVSADCHLVAFVMTAQTGYQIDSCSWHSCLSKPPTSISIHTYDYFITCIRDPIHVQLSLPVYNNQLTALQLQSEEAWPLNSRLRVSRTAHPCV